MAASATQTTKPKVIHFAFLDGMRGLAALWVMLYHIHGTYVIGFPNGRGSYALPFGFDWINNGHYGVPIFIVLSGFCLMLPVAKDASGELRGGFAGFMKRRAYRIIPPYYAAIVLALGTTYLSHFLKSRVGIHDSSEVWRQNFDLRAIVLHLLLLQGLSETYCHFFQALWSVGVEWNIYWIFALLLLPVWRRFRGPQGSPSALLAVLIVGGALGYGIPLLLPNHYNLAWCSPWFVGLFALGMSAAVVVNSEQAMIIALRNRTKWAEVALSAMVIAFAYNYVPGNLYGVGWISDTIVGFCAVTLIVACTQLSIPHFPLRAQFFSSVSKRIIAFVRRILEARCIVALGTISYSLYLTHGSIITRVGALTATHVHAIVPYSVLVWGGGVVASILFAIVFFYAMERPFLSLRAPFRLGRYPSAGILLSGWKMIPVVRLFLANGADHPLDDRPR